MGGLNYCWNYRLSVNRIWLRMAVACLRWVWVKLGSGGPSSQVEGIPYKISTLPCPKLPGTVAFSQNLSTWEAEARVYQSLGQCNLKGDGISKDTNNRSRSFPTCLSEVHDTLSLIKLTINTLPEGKPAKQKSYKNQN